MKKVNEFLEEKLKLTQTVIVSCSGGPDSMCLLSLIDGYKKKNDIKVICAHVNHKVRTESDEEEDFVRNYCLERGITFELLTIRNYDGNFHNDARVQRYMFLKELCLKYDSKQIYTAHHGDDLVESSLMRISRGSNLSGYAGFKKELLLDDVLFIKPLIFIDKNRIINYNNENNIEYRLDKTNNSLEYTRNKYRHKVLPQLKEIDNDIHLKFIKFGDKLHEYAEFVDKYISSKEFILEDSIDIPKYIVADNFIQKRVIENLITLVQKKNEFYVKDNVIKEIDKLLKSEKKNACINLPNGFIGEKKNNKFVIKKINIVL